MIGQIHVPMNSIDLGQVYEDWRDLEPANDDKVNIRKNKISNLTLTKVRLVIYQKCNLRRNKICVSNYILGR